MRERTPESRELHDFAVRASRTAAQFGREHWRGLGAATLAGTFMALTEAFETTVAPLPHRLAFWVPTMAFGAVIGALVSQTVTKRPRIGDSPWLLWSVVSLSASVPIAAFVWWYAEMLFGVRPGDPLIFFLNVLLVAAAMTAIMMLVYRPGPATQGPPIGAAPRQVRFLKRLPPKLMGGVIYAVSAEDHYLRLHTSKGSDLILMRLSDAIAELDGIEGAQTHRSWWVAREAVESTRREGDRVVLVLKGGAEAPVSRPNLRPLREAGWC